MGWLSPPPAWPLLAASILPPAKDDAYSATDIAKLKAVDAVRSGTKLACAHASLSVVAPSTAAHASVTTKLCRPARQHHHVGTSQASCLPVQAGISMRGADQSESITTEVRS